MQGWPYKDPIKTRSFIRHIGVLSWLMLSYFVSKSTNTEAIPAHIKSCLTDLCMCVYVCVCWQSQAMCKQRSFSPSLVTKECLPFHVEYIHYSISSKKSNDCCLYWTIGDLTTKSKVSHTQFCFKSRKLPSYFLPLWGNNVKMDRHKNVRQQQPNIKIVSNRKVSQTWNIKYGYLLGI